MDYDAQLLTLNNFSLQTNNDEPNYTRNINNENNIAEFQLQLIWEQWDNIFGNNDNNIFNNFLNTYLRIYDSSFVKKKKLSPSMPIIIG